MKKLITSLCGLIIIGSVFAQSTFVSELQVKAPKKANIYGVVECQGTPVEGVIVSDGFEMVKTDKKGVYAIQSQKKTRNVFITIPSGYMTPLTEQSTPMFWAELTKDTSEAERHDFSLEKVDNKKHIMLAITDLHLANMYNDLEQFKTIAMPRINEEVEKYRSQGLPVYTMCMGDSSFDLFWYDYLYEISDFKKTLGDVKYPTPLFHTMGNHDNDGATPYSPEVDFNAETKYRHEFGPTYYSFNIGDIHYIMLDNIIYFNRPGGGKKGMNMAGRRDYEHGFNEAELEWLKKDLALVKDKNTPIFIGMHCPIWVYSGMSKKIKTRLNKYDENFNKKNSAERALEFANILKDFTNVHYVTGHTHKNLTVHGKNDTSKYPIANTIDHNIAALSGCWWRTQVFGGLSLGPDSGPSGFEVFPIDGRNIEWYFTSNDDGCQKQFRVFDMNEVRKFYQTNGEMRAYILHYPKAANYAEIEDNMVYIHVWAWEPTWKVSVKENGVELNPKRANLENPQYTLSYYIPKSNWGKGFPAKDAQSDKCPHMFQVKTSSATSTLEVTVTDGFGHEYKETVVRPKAFTKTMR